MHKKIFFSLLVFSLMTVILAACGIEDTATTPSGTSTSTTQTGTPATGPAATQAPSCPAGDTVKTAASTFEQSCITLSKGGTLKVVPDTGSAFHILDYGQYVNGTAQPQTPSGVPALKDLNLTNSAVSIGPFTTAGTFHIYCTVHPGMDMTVIVK